MRVLQSRRVEEDIKKENCYQNSLKKIAVPYYLSSSILFIAIYFCSLLALSSWLTGQHVFS